MSSGAEIILPHVVTPENLLLTHDERIARQHTAAEVVGIARKHKRVYREGSIVGQQTPGAKSD